MNNLTVNELLEYIPYGLEYSTKNDKGNVDKYPIKADNVNTIVNTVNKGMYGDDYKPIMRPMEDLALEFFWKELLELVIRRGGYKSSFADGHNSYRCKIVNKSFGKMLKITNGDDWVQVISFDEPDRCKTYVYKWMLKHRFDINGLIPQGMALDINKVTETQKELWT